MRFGLNMPNFGDFADPATIVSLAQKAEAAGWDGFFVWDHINPFGEIPVPVADPWVLLTAVAQATHRLMVGPMVTPLPRRRPWVLARQTASLDGLSGGRLILGVGLGLPATTEYEAFGEESDLKIRAEKLDEGLAVLEGLWSGEPFEFQGKHYRVGRTRFLPTPVQKPRIPVWVAGALGKQGPLRRAARYDGYFPLKLDPNTGEDGGPISAEEFAQARGQLEALRDGRPAEVVMIDGLLDPASRDVDRLREFEAAGVTWNQAALDTREVGLDQLIPLIEQGPPKL